MPQVTRLTSCPCDPGSLLNPITVLSVVTDVIVLLSGGVYGMSYSFMEWILTSVRMVFYSKYYKSTLILSIKGIGDLQNWLRRGRLLLVAGQSPSSFGNHSAGIPPTSFIGHQPAAREYHLHQHLESIHTSPF